MSNFKMLDAKGMADKIIHKCEVRAKQYEIQTGVYFPFLAGYLEAQIRDLCEQLYEFEVPVSKYLSFVYEANGGSWFVEYECHTEEDFGGREFEEAEIHHVWVNGMDIAQDLPEDMLDMLSDLAKEEYSKWQEDEEADYKINQYLAGRND